MTDFERVAASLNISLMLFSIRSGVNVYQGANNISVLIFFLLSHTPSTATKCSRYRKRRRRSKSGSSPQKSVPLLPEDAACSSSSPYLHDLKSHGDSNHGKQQQPSCLFNSVTLQAKEPSNSLHQTSDSSLYQVEIHDEQTRSGKAVQWGGGAALAPPPTTELQVQEPPPCKKKRRRRKSKPENAGCNDLSQVNILEPGDQLQQSPVGLVIPPPAVSSLSIVKHLEGTNCCVPSSHNANVGWIYCIMTTCDRICPKPHTKGCFFGADFFRFLMRRQWNDYWANVMLSLTAMGRKIFLLVATIAWEK